MVIFRENTEDLYSGLEHEVVKDVVTSLKVITRAASMRIAELCVCFRAEGRAQEGDRRPQSQHHEARRRAVPPMRREVAPATIPDIEYKELIVDNASMQLVMRPETFDILLMPNLYGDIVSDLAAGLVGGLGIVPGANMGEDMPCSRRSMAARPTSPGKGIANPTALMLSAVMMLIHCQGARRGGAFAARLSKVSTLKGEHLPRDVGGKAGTAEFTEAVIRELR